MTEKTIPKLHFIMKNKKSAVIPNYAFMIFIQF